jgi:hypothetical protein
MKQNVTVISPTHHETQSLFNPASIRNAVKTKSAVLRGASNTRGTMRTRKKMTWQRPPTTWIVGRNLIP